MKCLKPYAYLSEMTKDIVREVSEYIKFIPTWNSTSNNKYLSKYSVQNIAKQYELMFI
jgi:hypothetical protein